MMVSTLAIAKRRYRIMACLLLCAGFMHSTAMAQAEVLTLQVNAGSHARAGSIVFCQLPGASADYFVATNLYTRRQAPVQRLLDGRYAFVMPDTLQPGTMTYYRLVARQVLENDLVVKALETHDRVAISQAGKPVLSFQKNTAPAHPDSPVLYRRGGFIHPLYCPEGQVLTDDFPVGYAHHNGVFSAWVSTLFQDSPIDFWNRQRGTGTVRFDAIDKVAPGPAACQLRATQYFSGTGKGDILQENMTLTVYAAAALYYVCDVEIVQTNIAPDTLFINPYHYGGFAYRGSKHWNSADTANYQANWHILTNAGYRDTMANATGARWVAAWGLIHNRNSGMAMLSHSTNIPQAQPLRVHPQHPYFCMVPVAQQGLVLAPAQVYKAAYRIITFNGIPNTALLNQQLTDLRFPPVVYVSR